MEQPQSGPSAPIVELMEQGLTILRAENENLQTMAIQRPREVGKLSKACIDELRAFPQFAEKMYYSIPYKDRSGEKEKTVMVEGPSIKAANALARHWGNNSTGWRIIGSDEERINIQGVFIDHETGMRRTAEISVSRRARKRDGTYYALAADRLNIAIQAGGSKAVRNAINNALPIGLVEGYFAEAKRIAARGGQLSAPDSPEIDTAAISAQLAKSIQQLEAMGVERSDMEAYILRQPKLDNEEAISAHLVGLITAIEEGHITLEAAFAPPDEPIAEPVRASEVQAKEPPAPVKKAGLPKDRQRIQAKFDSGNCSKCQKPIRKGDWIWKDGNFWVHEADGL